MFSAFVNSFRAKFQHVTDKIVPLETRIIDNGDNGNKHTW